MGIRQRNGGVGHGQCCTLKCPPWLMCGMFARLMRGWEADVKCPGSEWLCLPGKMAAAKIRTVLVKEEGKSVVDLKLFRRQNCWKLLDWI